MCAPSAKSGVALRSGAQVSTNIVSSSTRCRNVAKHVVTASSALSACAFNQVVPGSLSTTNGKDVLPSHQDQHSTILTKSDSPTFIVDAGDNTNNLNAAPAEPPTVLATIPVHNPPTERQSQSVRVQCGNKQPAMCQAQGSTLSRNQQAQVCRHPHVKHPCAGTIRLSPNCGAHETRCVQRPRQTAVAHHPVTTGHCVCRCGDLTTFENNNAVACTAEQQQTAAPAPNANCVVQQQHQHHGSESAVAEHLTSGCVHFVASTVTSCPRASQKQRCVQVQQQEPEVVVEQVRQVQLVEQPQQYTTVVQRPVQHQANAATQQAVLTVPVGIRMVGQQAQQQVVQQQQQPQQYVIQEAAGAPAMQEVITTSQRQPVMAQAPGRTVATNAVITVPAHIQTAANQVQQLVPATTVQQTYQLVPVAGVQQQGVQSTGQIGEANRVRLRVPHQIAAGLLPKPLRIRGKVAALRPHTNHYSASLESLEIDDSRSAETSYVPEDPKMGYPNRSRRRDSYRHSVFQPSRSVRSYCAKKPSKKPKHSKHSRSSSASSVMSSMASRSSSSTTASSMRSSYSSNSYASV